ncbi:MAG TPA: hypothetical protein VNY83_04945 [Solirubrobacterales bacterium]|jgi:hypothetical protein|nr:hypothetical protein [Solirubrobacterales bacterium]
MSDSMQITVLTVDPEGHVGADFTGLVNAQGLIMPEGGETPEFENYVEWVDPQGNAEEALVGYHPPETSALFLLVNRLFKRLRGLLGLYAYGSKGEEAKVELRAGGGSEEITVGTSSSVLTLIDSTERSSWLKLAGALGDVRINMGLAQLTFVESTLSNNVRVAHGLGRTPQAIAFGSSDTNDTPAWDTPNEGTFGLSARRATKASGTVSVFWIAIG